jgi:hypothetical protein
MSAHDQKQSKQLPWRAPASPPSFSQATAPLWASCRTTEKEVRLATLVDEAPTGDRWIHEIKFDGYRMVCSIRDGNVRLISRNDKDWTTRFAFFAVCRSKSQGNGCSAGWRNCGALAGWDHELPGLAKFLPGRPAGSDAWYSISSISMASTLRRADQRTESDFAPVDRGSG